MATKVNGLIQKVNPGNNTQYSIASTAYGYCETAAATAAKVVDMAGFTLLEGTTIHVKFKNNNTVASPTLNVNGTGAKPIVQYGTTAASTGDATTGWYAGAVVSFTYDGTSWVRDQGFNTDTHQTTHLYAGNGTAANKATTNGNTKISVTDNSTVRNSITVKGSGTTSVTSDANGVITISSADSKTGTVTSITPGNGLLNGTTTNAITTSGTLNINYGTTTAKIGTAAAGSATTVSRSDHVHAIDLATGDANGQVKIAGINVSVKGLGSNAYTSTSYLPLSGGTMTGGINPSGSISLGTSSAKWNNIYGTNVYATTFTGAMSKSITIGDKSYDGSDDVVIDLTDLHLSTSMEFKGIVTNTLTDGASTPTSLTLKNGGTLTVSSTTGEGYVVIDATGKEYIWSGNPKTWNNLGVATDFALSEHVHGNIKNNGAIGTTSGYAVYTTTNGVLMAGTLATSDPDTSKPLVSSITQDSKGKISITKANFPTASTNNAGIVQLSTSVSSTATNLAATPSAVKSAYTLANNALPKSGGTMTGNLTLNALTGTSACYGDTLPATGTNGQIFFRSRAGAAIDTLVARLDALEGKIYPVGSIYISVNSTSPATLFGGTWERIQDTFLLAAGTTYAAGSTGGKASHTLIENELPGMGGFISPQTATDWGDAGEATYYMPPGNVVQYSTNRPYVLRAGNEIVPRSFTRGGGQAHNNMPPYLAVYVWKRTA